MLSKWFLNDLHKTWGKHENHKPTRTNYKRHPYTEADHSGIWETRAWAGNERERLWEFLNFSTEIFITVTPLYLHTYDDIRWQTMIGLFCFSVRGYSGEPLHANVISDYLITAWGGRLGIKTQGVNPSQFKTSTYTQKILQWFICLVTENPEDEWSSFSLTAWQVFTLEGKAQRSQGDLTLVTANSQLPSVSWVCPYYLDLVTNHRF